MPDLPEDLFDTREQHGLTVVFSNVATASYSVAGVPAAARVVRSAGAALAAAGRSARVALALPDGWLGDAPCRDEMARVAPGVTVAVVDGGQLDGAGAGWFVCGEMCPPQPVLQAALATGVANPQAGIHADIAQLREWYARQSEADLRSALAHASWRVIRATGKAGDGLVSRWCNRPVSNRLTALALLLPAARPIHATFVAAAVGLAMALCLFAAGAAGLMAGAVLLQLASVIDGVDGEMARATFRTSARGASLDSITDAVTNLAFVAGLAWNLWQGGNAAAPLAGAVCFGAFGLGLLLLGVQARLRGQPVNFDALKHVLNARPGRAGWFIARIGSRDVLAALAMVLVLLGQGWPLLLAFAAAAAGWLVAVCVVIARQSGLAARPTFTHIGSIRS